MSHALSAEARRLRLADDEIRAERSRGEGSFTGGSPTLLGTLATAGGAGVFCTVDVTEVLGTETAGGAGTTTALSTAVVALNLGSAAPPSGALVVCTFVPHRWVFRYDG